MAVKEVAEGVLTGGDEKDVEEDLVAGVAVVVLTDPKASNLGGGGGEVKVLLEVIHPSKSELQLMLATAEEMAAMAPGTQFSTAFNDLQ